MAEAPSATVPTTMVVGYFNPNKFPVNIMSPDLGINTTVPPPRNGKIFYLQDAAGRRINDPRLESLVGAGRLAREVGASAVPVVSVVMPRDIAATPPTQAVSGQVHYSPVRAGKVSTAVPAAANPREPKAYSPPQADLDRAAAVAQSAVANSGAVHAYSMEQAKKSGLFGPNRGGPSPVPGVTHRPQPATPARAEAPPIEIEEVTARSPGKVAHPAPVAQVESAAPAPAPAAPASAPAVAPAAPVKRTWSRRPKAPVPPAPVAPALPPGETETEHDASVLADLPEPQI